ncbi:hypothetical protein YC2023_016338 [Brassica napus]
MSSVITKIQPLPYCNYYCFANFENVNRGLYHPKYTIGELEIYKEEMVDGIPGVLNHRIHFSLINIELFWRIEWGEGSLNHVGNYEGLSKMLFEPGIPEIQAFRMRIPN